MARPVNADAGATRRRILESALLLFAERGPDGSPLREIAREAGVSMAMVHHYFGNKDGLVDACVNSMYSNLGGLRDGLVAELVKAAPADVDEALGRLAATAFRFARQHQPAVRMLLRSVVEAGELDTERRERFQLPFLEDGTKLLAKLSGRPAPSFRLPLQTVIFATARWAASSERELMLLSGTSDLPSALAAVEAHLGDLASCLLAPRRAA